MLGRVSPHGKHMTTISLGPALSLKANPHSRSVDRYFAFACVDGTAEIAECYRLRYEVFCLERGLLSAEDYSDHLESDAYDAQSLHFLARHLHGEPAGTARLVLNGALGLPLVAHCALESRYGFLSEAGNPLSPRYAEISRLAVSQGFRRRREDSVYGSPPRKSPGFGGARSLCSPPPPADVPEMVSGLFRLIYQESKRRGVTHWVAAMERSLQVMLKRMGFPFTPIGPEVDYYGPVRPYVAEIAALERNVGALKPATLDYVVSGLEPHLSPIQTHEAGTGSAQTDMADSNRAKVA
jgi:N-acyl amino acid synthase of PEP-CTERM/exosortase system